MKSFFIKLVAFTLIINFSGCALYEEFFVDTPGKVSILTAVKGQFEDQKTIERARYGHTMNEGVVRISNASNQVIDFSFTKYVSGNKRSLNYSLKPGETKEIVMEKGATWQLRSDAGEKYSGKSDPYKPSHIRLFR